MNLKDLKVNLGELDALSPEEQAIVTAQLQFVEDAYRANPLLGYVPHRKQIEFHQPPWPPLRAFFGGNRSGKTTAAMVDTIIQAIDGNAVPDHLRRYKRWEAPFKCRIMTPDFGDTHEVALEKIREWCPPGQLRGGGMRPAYDKVKRVLWFKNQSRIHFNSNVQDREQLGGSDLHRIVYDEEPRRVLRNESLTRLIDHDGEEIFAMTPLEGMSWLFDELFEPWERGALPANSARILVVDMDDNPHLSEAGKARALAAYPAHEREARKTGRFVSFSGLIYPQFEAQRHVIPEIDHLPHGVECFEGVDPGIRHMCAVLFGYLDADDNLVIYDEIAAKDKTVKQVCQEILKKRIEWDVKPRWTVIDPASRNRNTQTGRSDQAEFSEHGIPTVPGQNAISAGINAIKERLDDEKLKVTANCVELRGEFRKYRWTRPQPHREGDAPQRPVKADDHLLDVCRYIVMARPLAPKEELAEQTMTTKDRMLRAGLKRLLNRPVIEHFSGPGYFG